MPRHAYKTVMVELRKPDPQEIAHLSRLCMRSKAYWGYDDEFMRLCAHELTLTLADLEEDEIVTALDGSELVGVAQVSFGQDGCYLEKLFVEPEQIGRGIGRLLFQWAIKSATRIGANEMIVEADPDAVTFYKSMGCVEAGSVPSGSIPGRAIPRLKIELAQS